jgi:hypothetical protein
MTETYNTRLFSSLSDARFDIGAYSRLKHGSAVSARLLGHEFALTYAEFLTGDQPVLVIPAPGTNVAVAATLLAEHFVERLNIRLTSNGQRHVEMAHVHRYMSYSMNTYADISAEERQKLLAGDSLHFPETLMSGRRLVFVDDVCITGTHEKKLESELVARGMTNERIYACYAKYSGDDPAIEGRLNKVSIKGPLDVVWLAQEPGFEVTVRCLRLLLEADIDDLQQVLRGLPRRLREQFCAAAIEKG